MTNFFVFIIVENYFLILPKFNCNMEKIFHGNIFNNELFSLQDNDIVPGMKHFPIYVDLSDRKVVVSGAGHAAVSKLRLLLKTGASIAVFGTQPEYEIRTWTERGKLSLFRRPIKEKDIRGAALLYCANEDAAEDSRVAGIGRRLRVIVNIVDNLADSDFITPAIVDRSPVTVAIGTEGAAPVLARMLKADIEERLPQSIGELARTGQEMRPRAQGLPAGRSRREFWNDFFANRGMKSLAGPGRILVEGSTMPAEPENPPLKKARGRVFIVGAGPGDPDLMTLRARNLLHDADVVVHDQLVPDPIIEIARRESLIIRAGKKGFSESWQQGDINDLLIHHASAGRQVVRLKSGDPGIFSRLDEETSALTDAGIEWEVIPGITTATAAAARLGVSLTRRRRNSEVRFLTGHDVKGFTEQDWAELAKPGAVAAIYMSRRSARFICGRMLMYGAPGSKPVTIVENATRPDETIIYTNVLNLASAVEKAEITGPTIMLVGLHGSEAGTLEGRIPSALADGRGVARPVPASAGH